MATILMTTAHAEEPLPSQSQMWQLIQKQQRQIEALQAKLQETDAKSDAAVEAIEQADSHAAAGASWAQRTTIGGYAEAHYNNLQGKGGKPDKDEIDLHRMVLFIGHEFNDRIRFFSEIEWEHDIAGDGKKGETEVEQAYVEMDINDHHSAKAGIYLIPAGILNETHEPNTFYGVERNPVEKYIVPATWWAAGVAASGEITPGWRYDLGLHEGLHTSASNGYLPRKGRQKSSEALARDGAVTGRLQWRPITGLTLSGTLQYQNDITQGQDPLAGSATLFETHAIYNQGPLQVRALYARWDLSGQGPESLGADEQYGWYIEPSFKLSEDWGLFARYNQWDNQAGTNTDSRNSQWDLGFNWWPHEMVTLKADYQFQDNQDGRGLDGFNLGVGLQF